jgi:chloramphenicol-sensitive protein RarD
MFCCASLDPRSSLAMIARHASLSGAMNTESSAYRRGFAAVAAAFGLWGLFPLYFKELEVVPPLQISAHRLVWGCVVAVLWLLARREVYKVWAALAQPRTRWMLVASAFLISINWVVYVWGVANARVIETSLGYFINPLVNVLLGVIVLSERLNRWQWSAVGLAAIAVVYLTWSAGQPPWISLVLACSFSAYGLVRKIANVDSLVGFACETLLLLPLGIGYLLWAELNGTGALGHTGAGIALLLALGGPLTAIPLVLFGFGTLRIPYSTVGLIQYMAPTIQLLLGVFLYHEPFDGARALGFSLIWLALALYATDGLRRARKVEALRTA